jgi:ankyrin repeat protein
MNTDFFQAVESGDHEYVKKELEQDPSLANAENEHGLTALGLAAHFGHTFVIKALLSAGADINALSHSQLPFIPSNTALHAAIAGKQSVELVALLIEHGADVNAVDSEGHKPIQSAAFEGNIEIANVLIRHGADVESDGGQGSAAAIAEKRGNGAFAALMREHLSNVRG